jgi:gamma-glutamyltranspeptidase/glutathione hydrolase
LITGKKPLAKRIGICISTEKGDPKTQLSLNGHLAAGVPGTIAGLFSAHQFAKLPFKVLIQPAIDLAEKGFVLTDAEARV